MSNRLADIDREFSTASDEAQRKYYAGVRRFREKWPSEEQLVLPTRFGNVVRAAETYPWNVYGVDGIAAWSRLEALIPKEFHALLADARSQVDFFINLWVFAFLFADVALARSLFALYSNWHVPADVLSEIGTFSGVWGFSLAAAAALLLARAAYEGAVGQASAWGELVKSAFDLYLPAFAKQLGYELPSTEAERRRFWDAVNSMLLYQEPLRPEYWSKKAPEDDGEAGKGGTKDKEKSDCKSGLEKMTSDDDGAEKKTSMDKTADVERSTKDKHKSDGNSNREEITAVNGGLTAT